MSAPSLRWIILITSNLNDTIMYEKYTANALIKLDNIILYLIYYLWNTYIQCLDNPKYTNSEYCKTNIASWDWQWLLLVISNMVRLIHNLSNIFYTTVFKFKNVMTIFV